MKYIINSYIWNEYIDSLFRKEWVPFLKKTFHGAGNAIEYLGRYTQRIAISNSRILKITDTHVTLAAKDYRNNKKIEVTLDGVEFIRRFPIHVLPKCFAEIRN